MRLRDSLQQFSGGSVAVVVSSVPYKCPGAPHEGAMLIADTFRRRGIREKVDMHLFTPEPQPMPVAGPELGHAVRRMLDSSGVGFHPGYKLKEVLPEKGERVFEGKEPVKPDLLVSIPPHRGSTLARESGLANETGWIPVDPATLRTAHDNVYAIGDATTIAIPGRWKPDVPLNLPTRATHRRGACKGGGAIDCHDLPSNHPRLVVVLAGIVTLAFAAQFAKLKTDTNPKNMLY